MRLSPKSKKELFLSLAKTIKTIDIDTWEPFNPDGLIPYYINPLIKKIAQIIKSLKKNKYSSEKLAHCFQGPTQIREEIGNCLYYHHLLSLTKEDLDLYFGFLLKTLKIFNPQDPFCLKGKNYYLTPFQLKNLEKTKLWQKADLKTAKILGKFISSLLTYIYSLYNDIWAATGCEFHGPYKLEKFKDRTLVVRDFFDLSPSSIWPSQKLSSSSSIRIFTLYQPFPLHFDFYGNFETKANILKRLDYWSILVDGRNLSNIRKVSELTDYFAHLAITRYNSLKNLNFEETKQKFMECHYFRFHRLLQLAKNDWPPTREMYQAIKNKKLLKSESEKDILHHYQSAIEKF